MKRFFALILAMMMAAALLLTGCEEEIVQIPKEQSASYLGLIQAYEAGKVFSSVEELSSGKKVVRFDDGHSVEVHQKILKYTTVRKSLQ